MKNLLIGLSTFLVLFSAHSAISLAPRFSKAVVDTLDQDDLGAPTRVPGPPYSDQQSPLPVEQSLHELVSAATTDAALQSLIVQGNRDAGAREKITNFVRASLAAEAIQPTYSPVFYNEVRLAGELRMSAAIPTLVTLLGQYNTLFTDTTLTRYYRMDDDPVGQALCRIHEDSSLGLFEPYLTGTNKYLHQRALRTLICYKTSASIKFLEADFKRENDPFLRKFMQGNGIAKEEPQP